MTSSGEFLVYVDEAGDRGWNERASPVFVLVGLIIRSQDRQELADTLRRINIALERPADNKLHWSENVRDHADRKRVARELAKVPMTLLATVVHKGALMESGADTALNDSAKQYNYLTRRLLERVSWYVAEQEGHARVHLAAIRRFPYNDLDRYIELLRQDTTCAIEWDVLDGLSVDEVSSQPGLQIADLAAGAVFAALRQDRHGDYEPTYLRILAPLFWTGRSGKLHTYGLNVVGPSNDTYTNFPWWQEIAEAAVGAPVSAVFAPHWTRTTRGERPRQIACQQCGDQTRGPTIWC